jgi:nucleotide-binding universal stress UspA family protein
MFIDMSRLAELEGYDRHMLLLAYDGSPVAKRALRHAAMLVGRGGKVAVINVIPVQSVSSRLETVTDAERSRQASTLREAGVALGRFGIEPELIEAVGDPATEILAAAEETRAKTIVVGRSERRHLGHGSLDSRLVRGAQADVLVVP